MIKKIIAGLAMILLSSQAFSQKNNISPYSFFGIGEETAQKTVEEISMGRIGGAFNSPYQLTFTNPAALASLRLTTYALAGENKAISIDDGTNSGSASTANLSYLAIGVPTSPKSGFAFGLQPNTTVGYSLRQEFTDDEGNLNAINLFSGEGGTNRVFLGFGYKLPKNISLGIEASYLFGNIENNLLNRRDQVQLATMYKTASTVRGFKAKAGVQYDKKINDKLKLKVGGVFNFGGSLSNKGDEVLFSLINSGEDTIIPRDTIFNTNFKKTIDTPSGAILSAGIGEENKWYAGIEYSFQNALEFDNRNTIISYDTSNRISLGGFYTPKFNSISSYWQRLTYRAGLNFKNTGLVVNNSAINDFGISFGVGLPLGQQLSKLNLGFELGKRGEVDVNKGLVKENYFNFRLSLTLNDKWFQKRTLN